MIMYIVYDVSWHPSYDVLWL